MQPTIVKPGPDIVKPGPAIVKPEPVIVQPKSPIRAHGIAHGIHPAVSAAERRNKVLSGVASELFPLSYNYLWEKLHIYTNEGRVYVSEQMENIEELCESALKKDSVLDKLVEDLSGSSRRARQTSSAVIAAVAKQDASRLSSHVDALVDALNRPEAQTRWECLDALTQMVDIDSRGCDKALGGAESALFDEESGPVRLAAMKFLCRLGSTTENRSEKTWPLIDEAIQCYHGDLEFQDMLIAVIGFSEGKLSKSVKAQLKERMAFDAANSKGALGKRAQQIVGNLK